MEKGRRRGRKGAVNRVQDHDMVVADALMSYLMRLRFLSSVHVCHQCVRARESCRLRTELWQGLMAGFPVGVGFGPDVSEVSAGQR